LIFEKVYDAKLLPWIGMAQGHYVPFLGCKKVGKCMVNSGNKEEENQ